MMDTYVVIMLVVVLILNVLILIFNVAIASFLVNGLNAFNNRLNDIIQEPPAGTLKNSRVMVGEEGGLIDIDGVQTYDPKFIDAKYVEN